LKQKRILINCSNLHADGGAAVATSVVDCLSTMNHGELEFSLLLSNSLAANLRELGTDLTLFKSSHTQNFYGLNELWQVMGIQMSSISALMSALGLYVIRFLCNIDKVKSCGKKMK
jgi:hypothetical protein